MFPLLPALLLLLLQGPANVERMASEGHLRAALHVISREMPRSSVSQAKDEVLLASLIAVSSSQELSQAFWQLLALAAPATPEVREPVPVEESPPAAPVPDEIGRIEEGFNLLPRSRDGPELA